MVDIDRIFRRWTFVLTCTVFRVRSHNFPSAVRKKKSVDYCSQKQKSILRIESILKHFSYRGTIFYSGVCYRVTVQTKQNETNQTKPNQTKTKQIKTKVFAHTIDHILPSFLPSFLRIDWTLLSIAKQILKFSYFIRFLRFNLSSADFFTFFLFFSFVFISFLFFSFLFLQFISFYFILF